MAKRHNPATIRVFLLPGRKGMSSKGISPKDKVRNGRLTFEPRNIPATQAQLTKRSHIEEPSPAELCSDLVYQFGLHQE